MFQPISSVQKRKRPSKKNLSLGLLMNRSVRKKLIANDGLAVFGDDDVNALAALELVGQDLAAEQTWLPANEAWGLACAASW